MGFYDEINDVVIASWGQCTSHLTACAMITCKVLAIKYFASVSLCVQAASPACTELETIVLDWLGLYY